jgi:Mn2+/Fe2+ NRAMP family transporter
MNPQAEANFRRELERAGEASVRADFYGGGGLATGGEDRREIIRRWLRQKEQDRENLERATFDLGLGTFVVAMLALLAAIAGVIATILHE